jgi:hypothetical protein
MPSFKGNINFTSILFYSLLASILITIAGLRKVGLDVDSVNYQNLIALNLDPDEFNLIDKEPGFWLILLFSRLLFVDQLQGLFVVFASLSVILKLICIKKYSSIPMLSVLLYISFFYVLHELTQIRTGIATAIFLFALYDLSSGERTKFFIKIFIASLFHYSAIVAFLLPIIISRSRVGFFITIPFIGILGYYLSPIVDIFNLVVTFASGSFGEGLLEKIVIYQQLLEIGEHNKINVYNLLCVFLLFSHIYISISIKSIQNNFALLLYKVQALSIFSFFFAQSIPVVAFRISEFLSVGLIILYPLIVSTTTSRGSIKRTMLVSILLVILVVYFFVISLGKNLGQ